MRVTSLMTTSPTATERCVIRFHCEKAPLHADEAKRQKVQLGTEQDLRPLMGMSDPTQRAWLQPSVELFTVKMPRPMCVQGPVPYFTVKTFTSMRELLGSKRSSVRKEESNCQA